MDDLLQKLNEEISIKFFKSVVIYDENSKQKVVRIRDKKLIPLPNYSSDIDAAYHIIKKIKSKNYEINIGFNITEKLEKVWYIYITKNNVEIIGKTFSNSLPELICRIALHILDKEKEFENQTSNSENILNIDFSKKID